MFVNSPYNYYVPVYSDSSYRAPCNSFRKSHGSCARASVNPWTSGGQRFAFGAADTDVEQLQALRAAEIQSRRRQEAELRRQYELQLAQIQERHRQQQEALEQREAYLRHIQQQREQQQQLAVEQYHRRIQQEKQRRAELLLRQQREQRQQRQYNENLINALGSLFAFADDEEEKANIPAPSRANEENKNENTTSSSNNNEIVFESPLDLLAAIFGGQLETLSQNSATRSNGPASEKSPEQLASSSEANEPASSTSEESIFADPDVSVPTEEAESSAADLSPADIHEQLTSIKNSVDRNIATYERIMRHSNDEFSGDEQDYSVSSLSSSSLLSTSSLVLRSRLKVLQHVQLQLEQLYEKLDGIKKLADASAQRLKHVVTGDAVTYADKVETLIAQLKEQLVEAKKQEAEAQDPDQEATPTQPTKFNSNVSESTEEESKIVAPEVIEPEVAESEVAESEIVEPEVAESTPEFPLTSTESETPAIEAESLQEESHAPTNDNDNDDDNDDDDTSSLNSDWSEVETPSATPGEKVLDTTEVNESTNPTSTSSDSKLPSPSSVSEPATTSTTDATNNTDSASVSSKKPKVRRIVVESVPDKDLSDSDF